MKSTKRDIDYCVNSYINLSNAISAGIYNFGKDSCKTAHNCAKKTAKGCGNILKNSLQNTKDFASGGLSSCKEEGRDIKKGTKNAWKYAVRTSTTTYAGLKEGIKNSDLALYFAKKGKDSVKDAAKEGKALVNGYIDEKANEEVKKLEK